MTTADVYTLRYDQSVGVLFAAVGVASLAAKIGLLLVGAGAMVDAVTGGSISSYWAILAITVLFVTYGMAGGLGAAIVTDFVQGIMTVVFSFLLLPFVLQATGGMDGVRATLTAHNPELLNLMVPGKIDTFFVVMFSIQALVGIVAYPFIMGICGAGRTEMDGRVGFMFGNILKRVCTAAWSLTALGAVAWYVNTGADLSSFNPDHLYGDIARRFLPDVLPGLLGVFLACLLASIMSSCDAIMISSAALFTENVYRPLVPTRPDQHYITIGRLTSLAVVASGVAFAYWKHDDVVDAPELLVQDLTDDWHCVLDRATLAWCHAIGGLGRNTWRAGGWYVATRPAVASWLGNWPSLAEYHVLSTSSSGELELNEPWVILTYMVAGVLACVVVSMATPKTPQEQLQRFYDLTRTPIQPNEVITTPCCLPDGVLPAHARCWSRSSA